MDALVVSTPQGDQIFTLKGAEQPYRVLMEKMKEGAVTLSEDDTVFYCNQGFADMLKKPLEKMIGTGISQFVSPSDRLVFEKLLRRGKAGSGKGEVTFLAGDGTTVPAHLSVNTMLLDGLSVAYLVVTDITERRKAEEALQRAHDELEIKVQERTRELVEINEQLNVEITERKQAVETLRQSEEKFASVFRRSPMAMALTSLKNLHIVDVNEKWLENFGFSREEVIGKSATGIATWKNRAEQVQVIRHLERDGAFRNQDCELLKKTGEVWNAIISAEVVSIGGEPMILSSIIDVTGRKWLESRLNDTAEKYSTLFNNTSDGVWIHNLEGQIVEVNDAYCRMTGYTHDEIIGMPVSKLEVVKTPEENMDRIKKIIESGGHDRFESQHRRKDGSMFDVDITALYLNREGGRIAIFSRDITERKQAEEKMRKAHDGLKTRVEERTAKLLKADKALLKSEANYRELTESIDDLFFAMDRDLRYTYWNKASEALTGILAKDAIGKSLYELFPGIKGTKAERFYIKILKTQQPEHFENKFHIGDKNLVFEINAYPTGTGLSVIAKDITEKKMLEAQLLRAQRMESIGTLAGGIAHDINNLLTPMMLSLQMLREKFKDESSQKLLAILEQNSRRGADLIKQVLSFTRGVEGERNSLVVNYLISEVEEIAKATFPRSIEIRNDVKEKLFTISGDATQLHQVIMNLCVNARDAMPDGGILSISAENSFIDENYVQTHIEARVGHYVVISVSDTGTGIPARIQDRIFDPFFTTKEFGKGTGLGLPTALAIVKSHGGFIDVQSVIGKGTIFKIYLPAASNIEKQEAHMKSSGLFRGNGETILVIDDEAPIRETTCAILEEYGYKTIAACDGVEAVLQYSKNRKTIELALIDMSMPVMDGPTCIHALLKIDPDVKIIAVSGLIEEMVFSEVEKSVVSILRKPYTAENLLENIHKAWLDTPEK